MVRPYQGTCPQIDQTAFLDETAVIIGDVTIGTDSSIWCYTVVRGDVHSIRIGSRSNVQDLCMLHVTHDTHPLVIGDEVTVGHRVVLHGCTIRNRVLIGMGAIVMDGTEIGEDSVVGAGALITEHTKIPPKSLVLGSPARIKRSVTDEELAWIRESAANYVTYARQHQSERAPST